jgi:hypothetical protein
MLGNSICGISPKDKRRLYIANVLPVMCYCAQLWWSPNWKGNKEAARMLQRIQNQAARWISGSFHTTPVGTLNALAGLIPVAKNIDILMHKAALWCGTLPTSYPSSLHNARYGVASKDHRLPSYWMSIIGKLSDDGPTHLLPCLYPGSRLIDVALNGSITKITDNKHKVLVSYYDHPRKSASVEFYKWLNMYRNESDSILSQPYSTTVYADGGVRTTASGNSEGTSAYSICHGDSRGRDYIFADDSFKCGLATLFDAEISAASIGIERAVDLIASKFKHENMTAPTWHDSERYSRCLVLCVDN